MRILIYSDLHLEFKAKFEIPPEDSGDVMVLAGDVTTFKEMENLIPFIEKWHKPILFVAGNHEYYTKHDMHNCASRFKEWIRIYDHITFLQDESLSIGGVNFFGGTMWTDLNKGNPITINSVTKSMNDYKIIYNGSVPLKAEDTIEFHKDFKDKLIEWFATPMNGPRVVITHHSPIHSEDPIINHSLSNPAFVSLDMEEVIAEHQPDLWIYGHTHDPDDRTIDKTRIVSNPRGYPHYNGEFECRSFDPNGLIIEIK